MRDVRRRLTGPTATRSRRIRSRRTTLYAVIALALASLSLVWGGAPRATANALLPPGFEEAVVFAGLVEPTAVRFAPDGRVFVAEKSGLIKVFDGLSDTTAAVFADLRTAVHNYWDRGLLSIELDPNFAANPYLYALYTYDAPVGGAAPRWGSAGATSDPCPNPPGPTSDGCVVSGRLSRLPAAGAAAGAEQVLINDWCQQFPSHSVGSLAFGADGALYVSGGEGASFVFADYGQAGAPRNPCGDPPGGPGSTLSPPSAEGGALRAQDLRTTSDPVGLSGAVIRVEPSTGLALPSNPLAASADPNGRRIVAYGLRNPFRMTVRPGTNELFVGDVGWSSFEEIDLIPNGADAVVENFGWPCYEGPNRSIEFRDIDLTLCETLYDQPSAAAAPWFAYSSPVPLTPTERCAPGNSSVSGLAFAGPGAYPADWDHALFFADYSRGCIWAIKQDGAGQLDPSSLIVVVDGASTPVELQRGPTGSIFYADLNGGTIREIRYHGANHPPTAAAAASPSSGPAPLTVAFDGRGSSDPDGDALTYAWDLDGDGAFDDASAAEAVWTYDTVGPVTARLRVTDTRGAPADAAVQITVGASPGSPLPVIDSPSAALRWSASEAVAFSGHATTVSGDPLPASQLHWTIILHHCSTPDACHEHHVQDLPGVASGSASAPDHPYPSYLEIRLRATDPANGATATVARRLDPLTVTLTFDSTPPGAALTLGGEHAVTPAGKTAIVNSTITVTAPSPQLIGGAGYDFASWSDGGARSHEIIAPSSASSYQALFRANGVRPGLVAAYGFNEGAGPSVADASGSGNTGTLRNAAWTSAGRFGAGLTFNGVDARVDVPDASSLDLNGSFTLEAWVNPAGPASAAWRTAVLKERPNDLAYALYTSTDSAQPGAQAHVGVDVQTRGPGAVPPGVWTHLAAVYDGSALKLLVNGVEAATSPANGAVTTSAGALRIGGNEVWGEWFDGRIDEVRIYNRALATAEINADLATPIEPDTAPPSAPAGMQASSGIGAVTLRWTAAGDNVGVTAYRVHRSNAAGFTPGPLTFVGETGQLGYTDAGLTPGTYHYRVSAVDASGNEGPFGAEVSGTAGTDQPPSVVVTAPSAGAALSGSVTLSALAEDDAGVVSVQFLLDGAAPLAEVTTAPFNAAWDSRTAPNGAHTLTAVARDSFGHLTASAPVSVTIANSAPTGLVAAYGFNENGGALVQDASGAGNSGAAVNAAWATGRFGSALSFNGANSRVDIADAASLDLTNALTIEAWVNPAAAMANTWRTVVLKERPGDLVYGLYASTNTRRPSGQIVANSDVDVRGATQLATGVWTHLAVTYDGATVRLYVNGALTASKAGGGAVTTSTGALRIGGNEVWGEWFNGRIDEVRVYNRALTATEIAQDRDTPI